MLTVGKGWKRVCASLALCLAVCLGGYGSGEATSGAGAPEGAKAGKPSKPVKSAKPKAASKAPRAKAPVVWEESFASLKERLIRDGESSRSVNSLFEPKPALLLKTVAQTFRIRESKLNYDQFLSTASIEKARHFLAGHESLLARAEGEYGVDREVIVAILLVETGFGSYTGRTPILDIFSTFALMDQESYQDKVWAMLSEQDREHWDRAAFDRKLNDRSQWAYGELRALLSLVDTQGPKVASYRGSVMGAVGWPQFLPSSLLRYGVDGNRDGRIDLFEPADVIHSVANYLRGFGWTKAKSLAEKEEVIWHYNHSRPYVGAILGVAARLEE